MLYNQFIGGDFLDSQFKKGILEICVLGTLYSKNYYGYELIEEVSKVVEITKGTMYPLLKRLQNDKYLEYYIVESESGPPRKYYKISPTGKKYFKSQSEDWISISNSITKFIKEVRVDE